MNAYSPLEQFCWVCGGVVLLFVGLLIVVTTIKQYWQDSKDYYEDNSEYDNSDGRDSSNSADNDDSQD